MANLPTRTTANTAAEHVGDHNNLHAFHNLIDAAGDLIVGTGVDTAGRLAKGSALQGLRVNAAGTALEYGADAASSVVFTPAAGIAATNVQAAIEEVVSDSSAAYAPKGAISTRAFANANQSIPNATVTVIALAGESYDRTGMHDTVTNNSRITIATAGVYSVTGCVSPGANTAQCRLLRNGTAVAIVQVAGTAPSGVMASTTVDCAAGDYIELAAYQASGSGSTNGGGADTTWLTVTYEGV